MTNIGREGKRHIKRTASFLLSVILIFTSNSASCINAAEAVPGMTVSEDTIYEETVSAGTVSEESVSGENLPEDVVSDNKTVSEEEVPGNTVSNDSVSEDKAQTDHVSDDSVSADASYDEDIPFGAFDDNIEIENPEPLPEFSTPASEGQLQDTDRSDSLRNSIFVEEAAGNSYAASYNGIEQGILPDSIRDQGNSSLCWAFSAALLAEVSMIKNSFAPRNVHYSEDQIGYFFFHHVTDPIGGTANDETTLKGSGTYYTKGGNNAYNVWNLASWTGVRDQMDLPFKNSAYKAEEVTDDLAYSSIAHLQNSYFTKTTSSGNDISYIENVKELVYEHGAASIIINSGYSINEKHATYSTADAGGHNVTIIGWDDNFPVENFSTAPPGCGAWYMRDNYGTNGNRDENGCFWMSYYDACIRRSSSKAIAFEFERGDNYDNNYQYDGSCGGSSFSFENTKTLTAANVFTAKDNEILEAVGFAPANASSDYEIKIYKLNSVNELPDSGDFVAEASGSTRYYGFRTVSLNQSVFLQEGQVYSVVVKVTTSEDSAKLSVDAASDADNWVRFSPATLEKQSYVYSSGWKDMHTYGAGNRVFRIKAYTNDSQYMSASYEDLPGGGMVYTGKECCLGVKVVSRNGAVMKEGTDYSVSYQNNINVGKARVVVTPLNGMILKNGSYYYNILPKDASHFNIAEIPSMEYTGEELTPEPVVKDRDLGTTLEKGKDYTVSYNNNINEGDGKVYITGIGNYTGRAEKSFFISAAPEKELTISKIKDIRFKPGAGPLTPSVTVLDGSTALVEGRDYRRYYSGNNHAGTAVVSVCGLSRTVYDNSRATAQFTILPYQMKNVTIEGTGDRPYIEGKDYSKDDIFVNVYAKSAATGELIALKEGTDYEIAFEEDTKIPSKSGKRVYYRVNGIGDYSGSVRKSFTVRNYIPISDTDQFEITLSRKEYTYDGSYFKPEVKVKWKQDGDPSKTVELVEGTDFSCRYSNNKNAGRASVTIKPTSSFTKKNKVKGSVKAYFTVLPQTLEGCYMDPIKELTYNSKARKPSVAVYTSDGKRLKSSQYYVEYNNNICVGTAGITVYGKKNRTGVLCTQTFIIKPQSFGKVKLKYKYDKSAGAFRYFKVCYGSSTLRENIDYTLSETGPDSKGKYTITVNAIEGRNFLADKTKSMKYKK